MHKLICTFSELAKVVVIARIAHLGHISPVSIDWNNISNHRHLCRHHEVNKRNLANGMPTGYTITKQNNFNVAFRHDNSTIENSAGYCVCVYLSVSVRERVPCFGCAFIW